MKQDAFREYFGLCDLHNRAFLHRDHATADKYWQQRIGFFNALEALGSVRVGDFVMAADRYVAAKFNADVRLNAGFLLERPLLTDTQYEKLGPLQLDELGDDE